MGQLIIEFKKLKEVLEKKRYKNKEYNENPILNIEEDDIRIFKGNNGHNKYILEQSTE